jgi:hypothetical protein
MGGCISKVRLKLCTSVHSRLHRPATEREIVSLQGPPRIGGVQSGICGCCGDVGMQFIMQHCLVSVCALLTRHTCVASSIHSRVVVFSRPRGYGVANTCPLSPSLAKGASALAMCAWGSPPTPSPSLRVATCQPTSSWARSWGREPTPRWWRGPTWSLAG